MIETERNDLLIASLLRPAAYGHPVEGVRLLETHISWVLLTGAMAYKIKKPVRLEFVDFRALDRRHWYCEEELRLNRRLAPGLYFGLRPIYGPVEEASFIGQGPVIEWAVQMRQFPQEALLAEELAAGKVERRHWNVLAERLSAFQEAAAVAGAGAEGTDSFGTAGSVQDAAQANLRSLRRCAEARPWLPGLQGWTDTAGAELAPVFEVRRRDGRVREGHGDLHLGNMVFLDDTITVFDCLEFSAELRWIDVMSEMAFLIMDLAEHGRPLEGARLLDRWLDHSGDYTGMAVWRWYVVYRALVRAKVTALRLGQAGLSDAEARPLRSAVLDYLRFAQETIDRPPGQLIITHGVSGSGKSHWSRALCERLGWIHVRSDAERKRLFGRWGNAVAGTEAPASGLYDAEVTEKLYGQILTEQAAAVVKSGYSVIIDATFLKSADRQRMAACAARCGARLRILDCRTSDLVARERIARRREEGSDPSDADASVLAHQREIGEPLDPGEQAVAITLDPSADWDELVARLG